MLIRGLLFFLFICNSYFVAYENDYIKEVAKVYFHEEPDLEIMPLTGGYSEAKNFILQIKDKKYVFRIRDPNGNCNEIYAMLQAAELNIAPKVFYIAPDQQAILMDFVDGSTLSSRQAHDPISIGRIARGISLIHSIPNLAKLKLSFFDVVKRSYEKVLEKGQFSIEAKEIMDNFTNVNEHLSQMDQPKVTIHGDLNPRNIFMGLKGVQFIDWSESKWEDPFHDIAYFSLMNYYNDEEENVFLNNYLNRTSTPIERMRYQLIKKEILLYFSLGMLGAVNSEINKNQPSKSWTYYISALFDSSLGVELNDQFFYEMSRRAFLDAKSM